MTRKQKIDFLKGIFKGNQNNETAKGESYWPPLCINPDGTVIDLLTGEAPTQAQIDKADRMPGFAGYIRLSNSKN